MRILLDVDGVLADFVTPALKIINTITERDCTTNAWLPEDITQYDVIRACQLTAAQAKCWQAAISAPGFCANLELYPGVLEALKVLRTIGEVVAVTTPFDNGTGQAAPYWMVERYDWLLAHGFRAREIIFTNDKSHIGGDVFVDDNAHHVDLWKYRQKNPAGAVARPYLHSRPWNLNDRDLDAYRIPSIAFLVDALKHTK